MQTLGLRDDLPKAAAAAESSAARHLSELNLLVQWPRRHRVFFGNLFDLLLFRRPPKVAVTSTPATFWPDVFVPDAFPARAFFQSSLYHVFVLVAVWGLSVTWLNRPRPVLLNPVQNASITYYSVSEYLPPISDEGKPAQKEQQGEPEYARQAIISVPPEADNARQTIITPPKLRLNKDVPLPNMVAWTPTPAVPLSAARRALAQIKTPDLPNSIVAPPPDTYRSKLAAVPMHLPGVVEPPPSVEAARGPLAALHAPAVIEPPPSVESSKLRLANVPAPSAVEPPPSAEATRKIGELNVGKFMPQVGAPKLPVSEQHASGTTQGGGTVLAKGGNGAAHAAGPLPAALPLPSVSAAGGVASGQLIALNLHPVEPKGPIAVPEGNRRGSFAATPEGKPGAPGTPTILGGGTEPGGSGLGNNPGARPGPAGIFVGGGPDSLPGGPVVAKTLGAPPTDLRKTLLASATPTRVADIARQTRPAPSAPHAPKVVDEVFGPKKYYSMILNMPNLTSAGGSWIIRFAELHENGDGGELSAPVATIKVDPAYPSELVRAKVEGTVMLYAVIASDGSVGQIRVLHGVDDRLNENARIALSRWRFRPATRNGSAVDLEAVVQIPFVARRAF